MEKIILNQKNENTIINDLNISDVKTFKIGDFEHSISYNNKSGILYLVSNYGYTQHTNIFNLKKRDLEIIISTIRNKKEDLYLGFSCRGDSWIIQKNKLFLNSETSSVSFSVIPECFIDILEEIISY